MVSNLGELNVLKESSADNVGEPVAKTAGEVAKAKDERPTNLATGRDPSRYRMITLERNSQGLGFNIVGGKDSQHIPGHSGIFVSIIKADGPAYIDGRLSVGDLILSINGIDLVNKTHDEAVAIFRSQNSTSADLLVEIGAEQRILNEHNTDLDTHICAGKSPVHDSLDLLYTGPPTPVFRKCLDESKEHDEDEESVTSGAPSVHSYLDDVPRTPKRPMSYLDPRNPSLVTEVLYVSIGLAVISLGAYVVYRFVRKRR